MDCNCRQALVFQEFFIIFVLILRVDIYSGALKTVGNRAFQGCENLEYVGSFSNLETIGDYAFFDCSGLVFAMVLVDTSISK